jgi:glutaconate CoA-transferase subunit B
MRHDKIRFVNKLDFLTTPGYLTGPGAREKAGLPRGTGPYRVITQLGVLGFDEETKAMKLLSVHPGVSVEDVVSNTSFQLVVPTDVGVTQAPSPEELRLLREEIDPAGVVIGG